MDTNAKPIPNATVVLTGKGGEKTTAADEKGEYSFSGLATGDYKLKASAPGFETFETDVSLIGSTSLEIDPPLVPLLRSPVPAAVALRFPRPAPRKLRPQFSPKLAVNRNQLRLCQPSPRKLPRRLRRISRCPRKKGKPRSTAL